MGIEPLLRARGLRASFGSRSPAGSVEVLHGLDMSIERGQTRGLVGESGSGKTVLGRCLYGLGPLIGATTAGSVVFDGVELLTAPLRIRRRLWGRRMAMVFQDAMTSMTPVVTIGRHLTEVLRHHHGVTRRSARRDAHGLLESVGIAEPERVFTSYPHQLSGGMRQRATIALALAGRPDFLVADEPTTALDVTIQAQVVELLRAEQERRGMAMLFISHDLALVGDIADEVTVMYHGRSVEEAGPSEIFGHPRMPYTVGLLASSPRLDWSPNRVLDSIPGVPPAATLQIDGCAFAPRCRHATEVCTQQVPELRSESVGHRFACWNPVSLPDRSCGPTDARRREDAR